MCIRDRLLPLGLIEIGLPKLEFSLLGLEQHLLAWPGHPALLGARRSTSGDAF